MIEKVETAGVKKLEELRQRAKVRLQKEQRRPPPLPKDVDGVLEELSIHQMELELQNEELRQVQQHLEASRQRYRWLYETAPVGYFTLDHRSTILAVNETGMNQLGLPKGRLINTSFTDYIEPADQDTFYFYRRDILETGTKQICELQLLRSDGSSFEAQLEGVARLDEAGDMSQIQMVMIDVSQRKQAESELAQYRTQLEGLVEARTAELARTNKRLQAEIEERKRTEATLQQSNERLQNTLAELQATQKQTVQQERLAAVGQLAAGIAHDFNNILTSIIGFAEIIHLELVDSGQSDPTNAGHIIEQAERAAHLVRQILDFSRRSIRHPQPTDLAAFLKKQIIFLERTIPENIDIRLTCEPFDYRANVDRTQLQQALTNLAVNARDAMPEGGILEFRLALHSFEAQEQAPCREMLPGQWISLVVSDTGSSIPAKSLPHIFEPFFTSKEPGQGTGLGLAQVYGIIKQHAGCINVRSQAGQGATFTIYLPRLIEDSTAPAVDAIKMLPQGQGETILLVEDERTVLEVGRAMLEGLNYRVLTATNGHEALSIYTDNGPNIALVLTDMVMPELDGLKLFKAVRAQNPEVRVIVMTGYPQGEEAQEILVQGNVDWIQKPLTLSRLARVINRLLQAP